MKYEPVIGLEVHVELYTKSKMFCHDSADYFGKDPNTHVCPVCLGLPGALPVPNKQAIEWCIQIGLALNCQIPLLSKFDRKNYFYPDLPKGYQISQYDKPFCIDGSITLKNGKKIAILRAHMEEDTAKLTHSIIDGSSVSLIDFNRSGVPLVEVVTKPDFTSAQEVVDYLKKLQQIVRYLGVSSADMEKGDMRLEPNISLRKLGDKTLPLYKVEVKNINSFKFVEKSIEYEVKRQQEILESGEIPAQETRGWNELKQKTVSQRSKEEAHDYRYFPEPDIPPIRWTKTQLDKFRRALPELPTVKLKRFQSQYFLSEYDSEILTRDRQTADFFEEAVKAAKEVDLSAKQVANVIINTKPNLSSTLPATFIKSLITALPRNTMSNQDLKKLIGQIIVGNTKIVADYKSGNKNAIQALLGKAMAKTQGKIDPKKAKTILEELLN